MRDMSAGSSIPLWVTIVLAVIALLGPWGGAWLASRRDDRRWDREQLREDIRFQRERDREAAQRAHEVAATQRSEKRETYSRYLATLMTWGWLLDKAEDLLRDGQPLSPGLVEDLENAKEDAIRAYAGVLVVADGEARIEIEYGFFDHMDVHSSYTRFAKYDEENFEKLHEAQSWVRRRARDELGIQPITDPDPMP